MSKFIRVVMLSGVALLCACASPAPNGKAALPSAAEEAALNACLGAALESYHNNYVPVGPSTGSPSTASDNGWAKLNPAVQYVDLNGDNRLDALVILEVRNYCGTGGCTALIMENTGAAFRLVSRDPTSDTISAQETVSRGWRDVWINTSGGGSPPALDKLAFDGTTYQLQATITIEQIARDFVRTAEIYVQDGHNLRLIDATFMADCQACYRYLFAFDHYGDPYVDYSLTVDVRQGHPEFAD